MSQGFTRGVPIDTDPNLSLDSDLVVPSQKAVKDYIDTGLNTKQDTITLTTTGTSGPATLTGATLNIPQYGGGGGNSIGQLTSPGDVTTPAATAPSQGVTATLNTSYKSGSCGVVFDGQGGVISNGRTAYVQVPYKGTITGWQLVSSVSGSCTITVRKDVFGSFPPTPLIITATLSGLTNTGSVSVAVVAGDWIGFTISGVTTVTWVNLTLSITKII